MFFIFFFFFYFFVFSKSIVTIIDTIQFFPKDKTCLGFSRVHYQLIQEDYRKKFHSETQTSMENASQYLAILEKKFDNWIRLSNIESFEGLREIILVEKFLHSCPRELALFIRERSPSHIKHLLELAKIFTSARAAVGGRVKPYQPNRDTDPRSNSQPKPNRPNNGPNWNQNPGRGLCYLCQKPGHRAAACPTGRPRRYDDRMQQPVHGHAACLIEDRDEYSFPVIGGGSVLEKDNLPLMKGLIGDQVGTVLRDTGSTGVMVKADLVHPSQFTGRNQKLMMVNSRLEEFPVAWIQVDTPVFSGYVQALCLPNPIYDLVIGHIPGVHPDIQGDSGMNKTKGMYQEKDITSIEASECVVTPINSARTVDFKVKANTCNEGEGSIQVGPSTNEISGKEEAWRELPIAEVNVIGGAVQTRGGRVREMHPLKPLLIRGSPEYQQCSPKQFKEAQGQDPSLYKFFEWAKVPFQGNNSRVKWFEMDGDLLIRRYKRPEDGILLRQ